METERKKMEGGGPSQARPDLVPTVKKEASRKDSAHMMETVAPAEPKVEECV